MYQQQQKQSLPCPPNTTQEMANQYRDAKVAFFKDVFTREQLLAHPKTTYAYVVNSTDSEGFTLAQRVGTENSRTLMTQIMFHLLTGNYHT